MPLAVFEAAYVEFALAGLVFTLAIGLVCTPLSLVDGAIFVIHSSIALLLHVATTSATELTFVNVTVFVCLDEFPCLDLVFLPDSFEDSSVFLSHFSSSVLHIVVPLANVCLLLAAVVHFALPVAFSFIPATFVNVVHLAAVCPESILAFTMVQFILELANVFLSVRVQILSTAGDRVSEEVSLVVPAIFKCEFAFAFFDTILKFAFVRVSVAQLEPAFAFGLPLIESTFEDVSTGGHSATLPMDNSQPEGALIDVAVRSLISALSMLIAATELTLVLATAFVLEHAFAKDLIILEVAFKHVAILVEKLSLALLFVVDPLALVPIAVVVDHLPSSMLLAVFETAIVLVVLLVFVLSLALVDSIDEFTIVVA